MTSSFWGQGGKCCKIMTVDDIGGNSCYRAYNLRISILKIL